MHSDSVANLTDRAGSREPKTKVMKTTIANLTAFYKSTKSECNFTVISFDAETKKRASQFGGFDLMHALDALSIEGAKGRLVILTNKAGWDFVNRFESENHKRVTFDDMKPYRMRVNEFSKTYESAANVW